jgi:DNA helicase II / ATP-dependent DNA helicase PcrA
MDALAKLNPAQRQAVQTINGPLLILAGPGSGKTRVITHRIAYLIKECGVNPYNILAVTFTNKAAREMKERLYHLVGEASLKSLTAGTFHAVCALILRREIHHLQRDPHFVIYDDADQIATVKKALKDLNLSDKQYPPRSIHTAISRAKDQIISPADMETPTYYNEIVKRVYERYTQLLIENNALDFDDLIMTTVLLFRTQPSVLERYQNRYVYVMVDEGQDTNVAQYELIKQFSGRYRNICVVADPDQSIYAFRGAEFRNVFRFEQDFPDAEKVLLEQNYRSTQTILDVAHNIISVSPTHEEKRLWTENDRGLPVVSYEAYHEQEEGEYVVREIARLRSQNVVASYGEVAIMYRTNAQSRALEDALIRAGLPYRLLGATRFYERREIKDVVAYLRVVHNPFDSISLMRVINVPARGLGARTVGDLERWADGLGLPVYTALQLIDSRTEATAASGGAEPGATGEVAGDRRVIPTDVPYPFAGRAEQTLLGFLRLVNDLVASREAKTASVLLGEVLDKSGYAASLQDGSDEGKERWQNVQELVSVAAQYEQENPDGDLAGFLEGVALVADVDNYEEKAEAITLLTMHSAKGLEFPVVFITGLEEGLLPHANTLDDANQMEEERRLFYVGVTRAMKRLYLVHCFRRTVFGSSQPRDPSRFLKDIPATLLTGRQAFGGRQIPMSLGGGWPASPARPSSMSQPASRPEPQAPQPRPVDNCPFQKGDRVRHKMFGEGIVVAINAVKDDVEITVAFQGASGVRRLSLAFAPLERIDRV